MENNADLEERVFSVELPREEASEFPWKGLYRIGGYGALIAGVLTLLDIIVFVVWPQPTTIGGWFTLFRNSPLLGLLDLDLLGIVAYTFLFPALLALFFALRRASQSWMAISTTAAFVGIAAYFASNTAFSMLSLSNQYAAAATDAQRSMFSAAGQAMIALFLGPAFTESYILVSAALLITSAVMLRSEVFSKRTARMGILATLAGLGQYVPVLATSLLLGVTNAVVLGMWLIMVGQTLYRLGLGTSKDRAVRIDGSLDSVSYCPVGSPAQGGVNS